MTNGYDDHSLQRRAAVAEAQSSSSMPMVAVRDGRFTRSGIGFRSQEATEAAAFDPGALGQTPPPIMYPDGYAGGLAARKRGQVAEAELPWETAQEATSKPDRPRVTLAPGLEEGLPPWLKGKDGGEEEKESLPPWLKGKGKDDEEKEAAEPGVGENWLDSGEECDAFPSEWEARDALSALSQFVDGDTLKAIQNQIQQTYGDPLEDEPDVFSVPASMGEAAAKTGKGKTPESSDYALPGRKYLIDSPAHARSALIQAERFGKAGEAAKVKAAVSKRYPDLKTD